MTAGAFDHAPRSCYNNVELADVYDLTGVLDDPLRKEDLITGEKYFIVQEHGKPRHYLMPGFISNIRAMKDHIREMFPMEDQPEIFGLHGSATRKATKDVASDIMHRTYIY